MSQFGEVFEEGFEAYTLQDLSDNPYPEGSDNWKQWNLGWRQAEAQDPLVPSDEDEYE